MRWIPRRLDYSPSQHFMNIGLVRNIKIILSLGESRTACKQLSFRQRPNSVRYVLHMMARFFLITTVLASSLTCCSSAADSFFKSAGSVIDFNNIKKLPSLFDGILLHLHFKSRNFRNFSGSKQQTR